MKTAFVFSGGASLGSIEVGMLKALVEHGIRADLVLGASVGSLNGAFYANRPTIEGVLELEEIWHHIRTKDVFTPSVLTPVKNLATFGHYMVSPKNLRALITEKIPFERIEDSEIPLYIEAADIKTGEEIVFNRGILIEALMASAGIPGVFPPQLMGDRYLVDGGMVNNSPISTAVKLGAERVVVFPIGFASTPDHEPKNIEEVLIRAFIYLLNRQLSADYYIYKDKVQLIIIPPPLNVNVAPYDFSCSQQLIESAYNRTFEWLSKGGYENAIDDYIRPCDVHSSVLNLKESILPEKLKDTMERIMENVPKLATLHDSYTAKKEKVIEKIDEEKEKIKDKIDEEKEKIKGKMKKNKNHREK